MLEPACHSRKIIFWKREQHGDRLELCYDQHRIRIARMNHVPDIHQPYAETAINWCSDMAIGEVKLGVIDLSLVGAHCSLKLIHLGALRIQLLLRDDS